MNWSILFSIKESPLIEPAVFLLITLLVICFSLIGPYVAPEIYKDEIFDRNVDIYSFGIVLYEV